MADIIIIHLQVMFPIHKVWRSGLLARARTERSRGQNSEFANFGLPDTAKLEENSLLLFEPAEIKPLSASQLRDFGTQRRARYLTAIYRPYLNTIITPARRSRETDCEQARLANNWQTGLCRISLPPARFQLTSFAPVYFNAN